MKVWCNDTCDDGTDARLFDVRRLIHVPLSSGRPLGSRFPADMVLEINSLTEPTDFFHAGTAFIASSNGCDLFRRYGVEAEYFPLSVRFRKGPSASHSYSFVNLTCLLDCLDWQRSQYEAEKSFAVTIRQLVLRPLATELPLARVERTIPSIICVSDAFADAIVAAGCSGVRFVAPKDWHNPMWPS